MFCPIRNCKHYIDYSNTSPIEGVGSGVFQPKTLSQATAEGSAGQTREKQKNNKYSAFAKAQLEDFSAFVTESTGRFNKTTLDYLEKLSKKASELKLIDSNILYQWMLKRLSVTFQNSIAKAISNKVYRNTSHALPFMTVNAIMDSTYVR